jgi:diguanylate cyclase (GGDEF)-like protein
VGRLFRNVHTKILLIDDSDTFCAMVKGMLLIQGLQVVTASDGVEGLKLLGQQRDIKLVLLDYEMPNMNGFDFLSRVRRKLGKDRLAVIGMAGSRNARMSAQFLKLGANDFIEKPFTYEELICRVSQNLEMQENIEAMRHLAYHDYLTGMLNRRAFFEQAEIQFDENLKSGKLQAVAMIDIDFFKKINDRYGHEGGDVALKHFAVLLGDHFKDDLVARVGGEEFSLLISDAENATAQCEAFRQCVEKSSVKFGEVVITFTISIGIASQPQSTLDDMLKKADGNLYRAKETGRNRIVMT